MAATGIAKYTLNQVNEHNKGEDLWVIIRDKVYDLTRFLNEVCSLSIQTTRNFCFRNFHYGISF